MLWKMGELLLFVQICFLFTNLPNIRSHGGDFVPIVGIGGLGIIVSNLYPYKLDRQRLNEVYYDFYYFKDRVDRDLCTHIDEQNLTNADYRARIEDLEKQIQKMNMGGQPSGSTLSGSTMFSSPVSCYLQHGISGAQLGYSQYPLQAAIMSMSSSSYMTPNPSNFSATSVATELGFYVP